MNTKTVKRLIAKTVLYVSFTYASTLVCLCDMFSDIGNIGINFMTKIVTLAGVLLPVVLVVDLFALFFTKDPRAIDVEKKIMIYSLVAYLLMLLLKRGGLTTTISNLIG